MDQYSIWEMGHCYYLYIERKKKSWQRSFMEKQSQDQNPSFLSPSSNHWAVMISFGSLKNIQVYQVRYLPTGLWVRRSYNCLISNPVLGPEFTVQCSREVPRDVIMHI